MLTLEMLSLDVPRVRSDNPSIAAAIHDASDRSATFRRELETIQTTDGLVYISGGQCGHSVSACLSLSIKVAGPFRLLRVIVNPRAPQCDLMSSIGHELHHAIEALHDPHVTDMSTMYSFFEREGPTGLGRFETPSALRVGDQVRREVCARGQTGVVLSPNTLPRVSSGSPLSAGSDQGNTNGVH
jgi:hypothetical protein